MAKTIKLSGRVFLTFDIQAVTGLHIGGSDTGIEIGGVDKTVIRDPLSNRPYIPGSSLKGKVRSLLEKYRGLEQNQRIGQVAEGSNCHRLIEPKTLFLLRDLAHNQGITRFLRKIFIRRIHRHLHSDTLANLRSHDLIHITAHISDHDGQINTNNNGNKQG